MKFGAMAEIRTEREVGIIVRAVSLHWSFLKDHPECQAYEGETNDTKLLLSKLIQVGEPVGNGIPVPAIAPPQGTPPGQ